MSKEILPLRAEDRVLAWVKVARASHDDEYCRAWVEAQWVGDVDIQDTRRLIKPDDKVTCADLIGEATVLAIRGQHAWVQFDDTGKFESGPVTKPLSQLTRV